MADTVIHTAQWLTGAVALASLAACTVKQTQQPLRPNILYIMTDDHTAQMMSCYDTRNVHTPNLDVMSRPLIWIVLRPMGYALHKVLWPTL